MAIDLKLTSEQKKQMMAFVKPTTQGKLIHPQEKIGEKIPKDFNPRTH